MKDNRFLFGSSLNIARVGNVFYRQGIIVVSDPRPKYRRIFAGQPRTSNTGSFVYSSASIDYGFTVQYKSTVTSNEYEYVCQIDQGDFNFTMNPTVRKNNDFNSEEIKGFTTHSAWFPYCAQVGLYNDFGQLLAVGKLASPIPIRDDVNTTFILRFDD